MKKMRRLIPAIAMLLVSAVMLSTASFAWFTMNQSVTATGMQVQAKATGSLVISTAPLMYNVATAEVEFQETTAKSLTPIHLTDDGVWQTVTNTSNVNPVLGTPGIEPLITATSLSGCYYDWPVYLGNAADEDLTGPITVTLTAPVAAVGTATKAYSIAVYVAGVVTNATITDGTVNDGLGDVDADDLVAIVHVDTATEDGKARNTATITLPEGTKIPSIVGVGDQNDKRTGLKLVLRVYADGALTSVGETDVRTANTGTYVYTAAEEYDANAQYYVATGRYTTVSATDELKAINGKTPEGWYLSDGNGGFTPVTKGTAVVTTNTYYIQEYVPANPDNLVEDNDGNLSIPTDTTWYTRTADTVTANYNYINSQDVPTSGSILAIQFGTTIPTGD